MGRFQIKQCSFFSFFSFFLKYFKIQTSGWMSPGKAWSLAQGQWYLQRTRRPRPETPESTAQCTLKAELHLTVPMSCTPYCKLWVATFNSTSPGRSQGVKWAQRTNFAFCTANLIEFLKLQIYLTHHIFH